MAERYCVNVLQNIYIKNKNIKYKNKGTLAEMANTNKKYNNKGTMAEMAERQCFNVLQNMYIYIYKYIKTKVKNITVRGSG